MKQFHRKKLRPGKESNPMKTLCGGILLSLALLGAAICVQTLLIQKGRIGLDQTSILPKLLYSVAVICGSFLTARKVEKGKLPLALLTGAGLWALTLAAALLSGGVPGFSLGAMFLLSAGAALIGGFAGARKKRSRYL